jgi:hypothetical protein
MGITKLSVEGYEKVLQCHDLLSGLDAIISIHNTTRPGVRRHADVAVPVSCRSAL